MDIKAGQAERFLKSPPREVVAVLLYGSDPGLVRERADRLVQLLASDPKAPGEVIRLDEADLAAEPDRLAVELRTIPMFGGRKIVRLRADQRLKPDEIAELLAGGPLEGALVVEGASLKPDSKLKVVFVGAANAAAVACYPDDDRALAGVVEEVVAASGLVMSPEARAHLVGRLGADRALSRGEVEKLALYAGPGGTVDIDDIDQVVGDAAELAVDRVVLAATGGEARIALVELDRTVSAGEAPQSILLALMRHLLRLRQVVAAVDNGRPLEGAVKGLRPPLHFKQQEAFAAQCRQWSGPRLAEAIALAQACLRESRTMPLLEREHIERLLIQMARLGRRTA